LPTQLARQWIPNCGTSRSKDTSAVGAAKNAWYSQLLMRADRRWRRPATSEVGTQWSARYVDTWFRRSVATVQARRFSLFGTMRECQMKQMPENLNSFPLENWRRPPGRPRTTWLKTIQQDLKFNKLSLNEAVDVAQNRPLWRLMSTFGSTHS